MMRTPKLLLALALTATAAAVPAVAQFVSGQAPSTTFKDTSMLKPPAGAKVAIWEFVDLECPACSRAYPLVHELSMKYGVPVVMKDFPLGGAHIWSFDAAVYARYMQDKLPNGKNIADQYRLAIFQNQNMIASKDDLLRATQKFLADRKQQLPFVVDPQGELANEVKADRALGDRIGINQTPTIWVVTDKAFQQISDFEQIEPAIQNAKAQAGSSSTETKKIAKK
ncbi:DsbA family protein [Terriglobus albidus]|uniref:DsbA family protein n=1 Tax=Terriglobus albidus TaxID=1592106 RepID=UPI0021E0A77D|nr:thioredoxin domain-containing protein [Terriglobus albidus]